MKWFRKKDGPPDAAAVMSRAVILKYQIVAGMTMPPPNNWSDLSRSWTQIERDGILEEFQQRQVENEKALRNSGLWSAMSAVEREFMRVLPSNATQQMLVNISWLMESAECLLWALGLIDELPPYDTQANLNDLNKVPSDSVQALLQNAKLRPGTAISEARDTAELWHWRSRTRQIQESGTKVKLPDGLTLSKVIQMSAERAALEGLFSASRDEDFPAFGRPYREISAEEWSQATSIAVERHKALNWLCGYAPGNRWDETPTET